MLSESSWITYYFKIRAECKNGLSVMSEVTTCADIDRHVYNEQRYN